MDADRCVHCGVLVKVRTAWYFLFPSPHRVLYTLSHVTTFLTTEMRTDTLVIFLVVIFAFTIP
jgi:hypothetical protein